MKRLTISQEALNALDLLIAKVGRRWKYHLRALKGFGFRASTWALKHKGLSEADIRALNTLDLDFINKTTARDIEHEISNRWAEATKR